MAELRKERHLRAVRGLALALGVAVVWTVSYPTVEKKLRGGPGSGGPADPELTFVVGEGNLVPGAECKITVESTTAIPLSDGRLIVTFEPPVFIDNPSIELRDSAVDLTFRLTPLGPGSYAIDFANVSSPLNIEGGPFLKISGIVRQDLNVGKEVLVSVEATATASDGEALAAAGERARIRVTAPHDERITLHVTDKARLYPGGTAFVEVSSYNPKPISDGQVCLRFDSSFFTSLRTVAVRGADADVTFEASLSMPGTLLVSFSSPTASINRLDGPLLLVAMELAADLPPGAETTIDVDPSASFLLNDSGEPLSVGSRSGRFTISW